MIVHCGARPVFVDVRDSDLNIDPEAVAAAVTERTKAILPVAPRRPAGRPRSAPRARAPGDRGRRPRRRVRLPRAQGRRDLPGHVLLAVRDEERRGRGGRHGDDRTTTTWRPRSANLRLMRRGEGSLYDITVAGFKANLSDVLAAIALCQLDKVEEHAEIRRRHVAAYDAAVAELPGIRPARARPARPPCAPPLRRPDRRREGAGADRDAYQRALREENIGTSIHFLPVHRLTYYRERYPDQPRLAGRGAGRRRGALAAALAGALRRRRRGRDRRAPPRPRPLHRPVAAAS